MALPFFYLPEPALADLVTLNEETSKHMVQVLRMQKGEQLKLTDGKGTTLTAVIVDAHKKACTIRVTQRTHEAAVNQPVCIAISLLKNAARFEWFLEKATEIGVQEIVIIKCDRTEKQHFKLERLNNILVSAMLQSQQCWLPTLTCPIPVKEMIASSTYPTKLIAHCEDQIRQSLQNVESSLPVQIFIGPEGDFSPEEIAHALSNGCIPVTLGNTRLRTETAGIVAATLLCNNR